MGQLSEIKRKIASLGQRATFERELDDEIEFHIESRAAELAAGGMNRDDATAQARREFGSRAYLAEQSREAWHVQWLEDLLSDLRYAGRALSRNPGFALTAVLSLALGIGVNSAIFSLTTEFLLSKPSARDPEALTYVRIGGSSHVPYREFQLLKQSKLLEPMTGYRADSEVNWRTGDTSYRLFASRVADNFFQLIGVPVAMGRPIEPGDRNVMVLSHHFWERRLGADAAIIGRSLVIDGQPHTVIGVLPADHRSLFGFGVSPELYLPIVESGSGIALYVRLPEGVQPQALMGRVRTAAEQLDKVYPIKNHVRARDNRLQAVSGPERLKSKFFISVAAFFAMLMLVVTLLVVIACANVASLLLARASSRTAELAIRQCIGASRNRLVRQLLAESLLLAFLGTAAGLMLNIVFTQAMNNIDLPVPIPVRPQIAPDIRLLWYATGLAFVTALLAGWIPAMQSTRGNASTALKQGERQVGLRNLSLRSALVAGQLAMSVIVLTTAVLFLRNLMQSTNMNPGFDVSQTVWAYMRLLPDPNRDRAKEQAMVESSLDAIRKVPGVESASLVRVVPLNDDTTRGMEFKIGSASKPLRIPHHWNSVGPDYFRTMGIRLLHGREFARSDRAGSPPVVVVNESFARQAFGDVNPVGMTLHFHDKAAQVVGVVANSKYFSLGEEDRPAMFEPAGQLESIGESLHFMVRVSPAPESVVRALNQALVASEGSAAVEVKPMKQALGLALLPSRVGAALLGAMGILGLAIASIGLYGVLVYAVSRRIREFGLRRALGAQTSDVLRMVLSEGASIVGIGIGIGVAVAWFVTKPLAMFLVPGLSPGDPVTYATVVGLLIAVGVAASMAPAIRAVRVDPMTALRYE